MNITSRHGGCPLFFLKMSGNSGHGPNLTQTQKDKQNASLVRSGPTLC